MFQSPRGTADILPQEQALWSYVRSKLTYSADLFGYQRIDTPIFEDTALFSRTVGEETEYLLKRAQALGCRFQSLQMNNDMNERSDAGSTGLRESDARK